MEKKISVIIPCYNAQNYIEDCLKSVAEQTIGIDALEVILVNDASTDETLDKLLAFEKQYESSVIVVNLEQNRKQGGARNVGLLYASGEYVVFLDADDWIAPAFYEKLYRIAKQYDTDIVQYFMTNCVFEGGKMTKTELHVNSHGKGFYEITDDAGRKQFLNAGILNYGSQTKFYKRSFLSENAPAFMEGVAYEEPSFVYPLLYAAKRMYVLDEGLYYCRIHKESTMQSYVRQKGKLYDHPQVQLGVYETMRAKTEIYNRFQDEIEYYFLFTFYYETLYFAAHGNLYLGYEFFQVMQNTVQRLIPAWRENAYIRLTCNRDVAAVLETADTSLSEAQFTALLQKL
ncbi:MAG: glycosyltransferase [Firmicutes bacterium]|nr:glycosyltransferase [Bacillota bacterium]